MIFNTFTATD